MPRCVSLFTGAGGLDVGLTEAGFKVVFSTDIEPLCKETYQRPQNFGTNAVFHLGNISDVSRELIERTTNESMDGLDLLAGGPPCPPYSKSRFYRKDKPRGINDPVGDETLRGYLRLLEELQPRAFLFENVAGFAYKVHPEGFEWLYMTAERLGYEISFKVLNAADYGVPQIRQRFIMVGIKGRKFVFPPPTHMDPRKLDGNLSEDNLSVWRTAGDVLCDLDTEDNASDDGHFAGGKYNDLLKSIPPGDNYLFFTAKRGHPNPVFKWRSRYWSFLLKLSPEMPSWTIQARRSNNMGPFHWRSRILRIEEVKRLQTFPDAWFLAGTVEEQWRQVGNAVPPRLAKHLGRAILRQIEAGPS
ncbi:DNA cytosine methyltransferase [Solidesulfovibrio sp. C21]|uniref:DNA cytosine methyltransferase n=1 Tax=Solidesulfovibrio sp. C21 TaxID=3398613 RepID=UPI0039FC09A2